MTLEQLYDQAIGPLPPADRFRLATMILNQIPPRASSTIATTGRTKTSAT